MTISGDSLALWLLAGFIRRVVPAGPWGKVSQPFIPDTFPVEVPEADCFRWWEVRAPLWGSSLLALIPASGFGVVTYQVVANLGEIHHSLHFLTLIRTL